MTEGEARAKWCPFARTARDDKPVSVDRDRDGAVVNRKHTCIASACMAWRWRAELDTTAGGYCGLAGSHPQ